MLIPPKYTLTTQISRLLQQIEAAKEVINAIPIPPEIEMNIRRESVLKSSLYSARIEGNPLTLEELNHKPSTDQKKREVFNVLKGLQFVHERGARDLTTSFLLQMHEKTMTGLTDKKNLGVLRNQAEAIYNSAGIAIYLPPTPKQIRGLIIRLLKFVNSEKETFIPVRAALSHYTFEKIHPFLDGNGRVGRLLLQAILEKGEYGMKGLLNVEEYLDNNRNKYYRALDEPEKDATEYVEFMLEAIAQTAENAKQLVLNKQKVEAEDYLLPRRSEILRIIKDQKMVSIDMIKRRFPKINERTLRYDLKKLQEGGFIRKRGTTKGVYYQIF